MLNQDTRIKFERLTDKDDKCQMQGEVSQILYLGVRLCFMKSRQINCKNPQKVSNF